MCPLHRHPGQVSSRAFRLRGQSKPAALLPIIDICNHSFEHNAKASFLRPC